MRSDDEELLARIRRGDLDAYDCLIRRWFPLVFIYLQYFGPDPALAQAYADYLLTEIVGRVYPRRKDRSFGAKAWLFKQIRHRSKRLANLCASDWDVEPPAEISPADRMLLAKARKVPQAWMKSVFFTLLLRFSIAQTAWILGEPEEEIPEMVRLGIEDLQIRDQREEESE
jgi:hypothetical protein